MKQAPCRALQGQHPRQHPPTAAAASPSLASLASFACLPRACNLLHQSFVDFCPPDSSQVQPISPAHDLEVLVPCPSSSLVSRLSPLVSRLSSLRLSGSPALRLSGLFTRVSPPPSSFAASSKARQRHKAPYNRLLPRPRQDVCPPSPSRQPNRRHVGHRGRTRKRGRRL